MRSIATLMIFKGVQKVDMVVGAVPKTTLANTLEKYLWNSTTGKLLLSCPFALVLGKFLLTIYRGVKIRVSRKSLAIVIILKITFGKVIFYCCNV